MIELILNTKFLFFSFTQVLHVSPLVAITKEKESDIFRLYFSCVCSGGVVGHWDTHTAQYVTPGAGPPLHNSILSPPLLYSVHSVRRVCGVTADWKSGRLSDLHGDTALKNDVCNRVGWWTQWLHLLPTLWSIGNGQKIRSTQLMGRRFSSSQTHTHTAPHHSIDFFLSRIYTHAGWLADWLGLTHNSHSTH